MAIYEVVVAASNGHQTVVRVDATDDTDAQAQVQAQLDATATSQPTIVASSGPYTARAATAAAKAPRKAGRGAR